MEISRLRYQFEIRLHLEDQFNLEVDENFLREKYYPEFEYVEKFHIKQSDHFQVVFYTNSNGYLTDVNFRIDIADTVKNIHSISREFDEEAKSNGLRVSLIEFYCIDDNFLLP